MKTYLVCDITDGKQYIGSTTTNHRPFSHLEGEGHGNWKLNYAKKHNHAFFVFISEDDGLEDRSEEQFYLDFYYGTNWNLNLSPTATGNPKAIKDYNEKVKNGLLPHSWGGKNFNTWAAKANEKRLDNGTHNFLAENITEEFTQRRLESVRKAITGENNPSKRPEVKEILKNVCKGRGFFKNKKTGEVLRFVEAPSEEWEVANREWWVNKDGIKHRGSPPPDIENWQRGMKWKK